MILALIQNIENEDEQDAINELFNTYFPRMQKFAFDILNNTQDAEDAAMEAMRYICLHAENFVEYKSQKTIGLIFICVRSASIDLYRRKQKRNELFTSIDCFDGNSQYVPEEDQSLSDIAICDENRACINKALSELEDMYRIPILMKYNYRMKNKEIAQFLNIDVNTVNGRIFRAKKLLKEKLKELGYVK